MVQIRRGFWLFDTCCTQALWDAAMANNPSRFRSPSRPVEQVSWDDCRAFTRQLNEMLDGLVVSLPSEAQWEYACRAGSLGPTYARQVEDSREHYHKDSLDTISWYRGNCDVGHESAPEEHYFSWEDQRYTATRGGTHPVGEKAPNPWGFYDMLGNVWEWCQDGGYTDKYAASPDDDLMTQSMRQGNDRAVRGGAWNSLAQNLRAACRFELRRDTKFYNLGFRCGGF